MRESDLTRINRGHGKSHGEVIAKVMERSWRGHDNVVANIKAKLKIM